MSNLIGTLLQMRQESSMVFDNWVFYYTVREEAKLECEKRLMEKKYYAEVRDHKGNYRVWRMQLMWIAVS